MSAINGNRTNGNGTNETNQKNSNINGTVKSTTPNNNVKNIREEVHFEWNLTKNQTKGLRQRVKQYNLLTFLGNNERSFSEIKISITDDDLISYK